MFLEKLNVVHRRHLYHFEYTHLITQETSPSKTCINAAMLNHGLKKWPVVGGECSDMFYGVLLMDQRFLPSYLPSIHWTYQGEEEDPKAIYSS